MESIDRDGLAPMRHSPATPPRRRIRPAARTRRTTLIASAVAALGLTALIGEAADAAAVPEQTTVPETLPSATSPPPTTARRRAPSTAPTAAPRPTTTTSRPTRQAPTRTRGS